MPRDGLSKYEGLPFVFPPCVKDSPLERFQYNVQSPLDLSTMLDPLSPIRTSSVSLTWYAWRSFDLEGMVRFINERSLRQPPGALIGQL